MYIGLVHRRRKERYTQVLARNTRERITAFRRSYSPVVVPGFRFRVPAFVHRVFESSGGGAALTKRKQLSFPLSRSSFHDETQWDCDCTVKADPFRRAMGENSPAVAPLNVICTNREGEKGCKSWDIYIMLEGNVDCWS